MIPDGGVCAGGAAFVPTVVYEEAADAVSCRAFDVVQCVAVRCSALQCVAVRCSVLQCCSVLQYVVVRRYWQYVWVGVCPFATADFSTCVCACVAVCCSMLQCSSVWCSAAQCGTVCCSCRFQQLLNAQNCCVRQPTC